MMVLSAGFEIKKKGSVSRYTEPAKKKIIRREGLIGTQVCRISLLNYAPDCK